MRPRLRRAPVGALRHAPLLWEPALGPRAVLRAVLRNVAPLGAEPAAAARASGSGCAQVEPRNALFLLKALRRTQRMMDPQHYLEEYDLGSPADSVTGAMPSIDLVAGMRADAAA